MAGPEAQELQRTRQKELEDQIFRESVQLTQSRRTQAAPGPGAPPAAAPLLVRDVERNLSFLAGCRMRVSAVRADETAPGAPVQVQAPVKKTYKEKRAEKKHLKEVREKVPGGTLMTYDLRRALQEQKAERANSHTPEDLEEARQKQIDPRFLENCVQGYKTKKDGSPLNPEEAERARQDRQFIDDYLSLDQERRRPHLRRFTDRVLSTRITPEMFTDDYVHAHVKELKELGNLLTFIENIQREQDEHGQLRNAFFFDSLPPAERELLDYKLNRISALFSSTLVSRLAVHGVDLDSADYIKKGDVERAREAHTENLTLILQPQMAQNLADIAQKEQELYTRHLSESGEAIRRTIRGAVPPPGAPVGSGGTDEDAAEMKRLMSEKSEGGESLLEKSDKAYGDGTDSMAESHALQELKLRAKDAPALQDAKLRGQIFDSMSGECTTMMRTLQAQGLPAGLMLRTSKKVGPEEFGSKRSGYSPGSLRYGGGVDDLSAAFLEMYIPRLLSAEGLKYMQRSYDAYGGTKVFGPGPEDFVNQWMKIVMVRTLPTALTQYKLSADRDPDLADLGNDAMRTLLMLPNLTTRMTAEEISNMTGEQAGLKEILLKYQETVRQLAGHLKTGGQDPAQPDGSSE